MYYLGSEFDFPEELKQLQVSTRPPISCLHEFQLSQMPGEFFPALRSTGGVEASRPVLRPAFGSEIVRKIENFCTALQSSPDSELPETISLMFQTVLTLAYQDRRRELGDPTDYSSLEWARNRLEQDLSSREPLHHVLGIQKGNYESMRKRFTAFYRVSPGEYRIRRRIDKAKELLYPASYNKSIKKIAFDLGYPDVAAFCTQFKKNTGVSPSDFW